MPVRSSTACHTVLAPWAITCVRQCLSTSASPGRWATARLSEVTLLYLHCCISCYLELHLPHVIHQLPKAFWNLRYTSHLQLQGEECVEEVGFGIQARKWRHFSCLSLDLEARQHRPSRDWWWEDLRRIPEGGLGAFGPQGQVVAAFEELNVESYSKFKTGMTLTPWPLCLQTIEIWRGRIFVKSLLNFYACVSIICILSISVYI